MASLAALVDDGWNVVAVVTAPDKPAGRGQKLQFTPVKTFAVSHGIYVMQPPNLKSTEFIDELNSIQPDIQIVVAFRMLPESVWNMPPLGTYNVHASLLPNYRGAAPINWAIINGETTTGVTTFKLKHEIDTGNILLQEEVEIGENESAGELYNNLMAKGAQLLIKSMKILETGSPELKPQVAKPSHKHAPKLFKEDCIINWNKPSQQVHNFIRGLSPFPCAYTVVVLNNTKETWKIFKSVKTGISCKGKIGFQQKNGRLLAATSDEWLEILELQSPGKKRITGTEFLNGLRTAIEDVMIVNL